jgi:hypothetical protein
MAIARPPEEQMRILSFVIVIWLIIGVFAGFQRHYYNGSASCAKAGTIAATVAAGPLNYAGVNPKVHCTVPQPSR